MFFDGFIRDRNQRKKTQELHARLEELERASLSDLLETIQDDDVLVRQKYANLPLRIKAIQLLGARGDTAAIPHLIALLHDDIPDIQYEVILALGALGDIRAIEPLERLVRVPVSTTIYATAQAVLQKLGRLPEAISAAKRDPVSELPPLLDTNVQRLLRQVHHADWRVRRNAVEALGMRHDPNVREALLGCLTDEDWEVRLQAIQALREVRDKHVAENLVLMMRDTVSEVSTVAMQFAESLGIEALEPLTRLLGATDVNARENAVRLLGKLHDTRIIEPLLRALCDSDAQVRQLAHDALLAFGQPVADALAHAAERPESKTRWKAIDAMSRLRDERMIPTLVAALNDPEADIRELAAQALQGSGWQPHTPDEQIAYAIAQGTWDVLPPFGAQAIPPLLSFANDTNVRVRRYIHDMLAQACTQVKTIVFGKHSEEASDPKTMVANIEVSTLTPAFTKLQQIRIDADTYDVLVVERFLTYAVNVLGEKFLKKNVTVHIIGNAERIHPNVVNAFSNLCKAVDNA